MPVPFWSIAGVVCVIIGLPLVLLGMGWAPYLVGAGLAYLVVAGVQWLVAVLDSTTPSVQDDLPDEPTAEIASSP